MSLVQTRKLLKRLASRPKDFTWQDLTKLMTALSFTLEEAGGSGRKFVHSATQATLFLHEPHPDKTLKLYQLRTPSTCSEEGLL